jgi:hypothetical protein
MADLIYKVANKYNMNNERRGKALVINIQKFDPTPDPQKQPQERVWSIKDVENLKNTLEYLEFEFVLRENLKANEIISAMHDMSMNVDHSNSDCFLCVVMSHGKQDKITASDNIEVSFEEIMAHIKSCKSLKNKPKLFLFQSCRGENEMELIDVSTKSTEQQLKLNKIKMTDANSIGQTGDITILEYESDLLIFFSTLPNHSSFAYLDIHEGTYFIKNLCEVLKESYQNLPNNLSLSQMITKINARVGEEGVRLGKRLQLTDPRTTLTKELYFMPKNVSVFFCVADS